MTPAAVADLYWDPFDQTIDIDPYPMWKRLRDEAPVYRNDRFDFYALTRHADVDEAHRDPQTYSSAYGTVLEIMGSEPYPPGLMIFTDPPVHNTLRTLVSRAFTPRRVARLEDGVRTMCAELLDPHVGSGGFDYAEAFATRLPSMVISELIGVDHADREEVRHIIDTTFTHDENAGMANETARAAAERLRAYFRDAIEDRRANPRDDMITGLAQAEVTVDGEVRRLSTEEAASVTNELVAAGT